MNDQTKGFLITIIGVLFIVPDSLFIRLIEADTLTIAFWRNSLSGIVMCIAYLMIGGLTPFKQAINAGKPAWLYMFFVGFTGILFVMAIQNTSVANTVFILASMPIFAAFFSWLALGERISQRMIWTILFVIIGIGIIASGSGHNENAHIFGDIIALIAAANFAIALTAARRAKSVSLVPLAAIAYIISGIAVIPFTDIFDFPAHQWWIIGLHGAVFTAISMAFLTLGPRYITSAEVSLLILLESVLAPLLVWFVIGEDPGVWTLIGGAIIISVLFISNIIVLMRKKP
ncbi:DMT family transporter [Amylibacter sp. SFDW26]|uniref:DMT family transporter n=1 Tax=Amylibacter sp. SFDW26 TaxID=2652722 RepID=UPI001261C8AC|nr:DMT family transporter [Amylibacter sp. SFDW26]KAB7614320.1 DMT family transporter [Amylibacter sp. SFDW26]